MSKSAEMELRCGDSRKGGAVGRNVEVGCALMDELELGEIVQADNLRAQRLTVAGSSSRSILATV